ncbi:hypothetical protein GQ44DRAFT_822758 [Phaeosphaeriaceae sp. PMI808]|nr:hypothetical protein GQ44DRAFT_822758 [Phaeosphaeriaceae sp. PMI808]
MHRKLKSVFRSSSKKKLHLTKQANQDSNEIPPNHQHTFRQDRCAKRSTLSNSRGRPLSSVYDSHPLSNATESPAVVVDSAQSLSSELIHDSIASDYKAYQSVLSPEGDSHNAQYVVGLGDSRLATRESEGRYAEYVADQNIDQYRSSLDASKRKPLPGVQESEQQVSKAKLNYGIENEINQLLGVVNLTDTVEEDKNVQWVPAVTHEVVKPHEHEIIQHKIFREIHNYEYHHYIQPVYDIEVLPPRHWIRNPNGEGLIEIPADELPTRTENNRRWQIVYEREHISEEARPARRTEPEIIEHPTCVTEEGFERKRTTIEYPPTLQDMTGYDGLVQPVHFDHKAGRRWLGEITTMKELEQELKRVESSDTLPNELPNSLPAVSAVPELLISQNTHRKQVNGSHYVRLAEPSRRCTKTAVTA